MQAGIAAALRAEDGLASTAPLFGANFEQLARSLRAHTPVRSICKAQGGYFLVAETDGRSDVDFCQALAAAKGVVATPMSAFYATPFAEHEPCRLVRFTVCKSRELVQRACDALAGGGAMV